MKRVRQLGALAAMVVAGVLAAGCSGRDSESPDDVSRPNAPPTVVQPAVDRPADTAASDPAERVVVEFSQFAAPGNRLTVTLPDEAFPAGATVTFRPAAGCRWTFAETTGQAGDAQMKLMVEGPPTLKVIGNGFEPPLEASVTVKAEGKPEEVRIVRLCPSKEQVEAITAAPQIIDVPHGAAEITVDGDLSDWQGIALLDLPFWGCKSTMARFLWRADGLYGAYAVNDDSIEPSATLAETFKADGLELWIETDGARSLDITRNPRALKASFSPDMASGPGRARSEVIFGRFKGKANPIRAAWKKTAEGYTLEFLLPAEMLAPAAMEAGTTLGFHYVLFNDARHAEDSIEYIRGFYRKPYLWAAIRLVRTTTTSGEPAPRKTIGAEDREMIFPGKDWVEATPESQGVDSRKLAEAMAMLREIAADYRDGTKHAGNTQGVVIRNGRVIWKGSDIDNKHTVYSCGKSFMSSVFGLLVDDKKCTPETRAADILPTLKEHYGEVTLGQFASFTSGYNVPWRKSPFEILPPIHAPGKGFHYSSSADQLAHLLTRIADEPLRDLFKRRIADPIGMPPDTWSWRDVGKIDGRIVCGGSGHVAITARQFARFGHLYLNKGRWGAKQLLSKEWVEASTRPQAAPAVPPHDPKAWYTHLPGRYGFNWWTNGVNVKGDRWWPSATPKMFGAQGNRNNYCFVIPEWRMVLVRMGRGKAIDSRLYDKVFAKLNEALVDRP
jgi:CubicO group peptidase (beta-lactamase class C family)